MSITPPTQRRRGLGLLTAFALAATGSVTGVAALPTAALADTAEPAAPVDYFADAYPGLGEDSVFETVTFERFEFLLGQEGTYAFLFGGTEDETITATIPHINEVAKQYGVEKIYNFDPRLDGDAFDVRDSDVAEIAALGERLKNDYLSKDLGTPFAYDGEDPYFFIYDKDRTVGADEDRIVAALDQAKTAADLDTTAEQTAYRAEVATVFDAVSAAGTTQADLDTSSQFHFFKTENNRKHASAYGDPEKYGGDILTDADSDFRIKSITYPELVNLLESDGNHVILFGGTWCHNTRAVLKPVNDDAVRTGVETVYNFDLRLDGASSNALHIRDNYNYTSQGQARTRPTSYLYGDLVSEYLPNLKTQYQLSSANAGHQVSYYPGGDTTQELQKAPKLQAPYLLEYDRANTEEGGSAAPVVQEWIQRNEDGTFTEYMTEWWYVLGLPGYVTDEAQLALQYAFAAKAVADSKTFFDQVKLQALPSAVPTISGTARFGAKLTARPGTWKTGTKLSYQWKRGGADITGATKSSYTLKTADLGKRISVAVTGSLLGHRTTTETSAATKSVARASLKSAVPKVKGTARVGKKLSVTRGSWTSGTKFTYRWYANGKAIKKATKSTLKINKSLKKKRITVKVTGKKAGYTTVTKTSKRTAKVK
ncbi:hypothetical protein J4H92_05240 [Leucobacter weissii]|uniref:Uncharacterized protein n=1 Tax=Leucobacter weissii TaxID=1983706 RepID=A0A939MJX8_9MICO|nr:hypothetical protein [Leucobacter weissii]MBO1901350.1 hypothetical protein [Leucobacter weissii]